MCDELTDALPSTSARPPARQPARLRGSVVGAGRADPRLTLGRGITRQHRRLARQAARYIAYTRCLYVAFAVVAVTHGVGGAAW